MREFEGRGADILAECLIEAGIDVLFGVPGDTGVVFYDALYSRTDRIRRDSGVQWLLSAENRTTWYSGAG